MTDIKLLPLPKWLLEGFTDPTIEKLTDYARTNVAHAIAAKDAEIERLRAEVCQEQDYAASAARRVLMAQLAQRRAEARAGRLAEALRDALEYLHHHLPDEALAPHRAALRDHDQEAGNG